MKQILSPVLLFGGLALVLASCGVKPQPSFVLPTQKLVAPAKVTFQNQSTNADSFEWDFGDGTTSAEASPTHEYKHSGNYTVLLKATKGNKTITTKQMIQVTAPERCLIEIETDYGTMLAELYSSTPKHRDNFLKLTEEGFFDGLLFHRVINNFMIQGGDPQSRDAKPDQRLGMGGPGYTIPAEFVDSLVHTKGAIAAARTNNPEKASSGSQFYIVHGNTVNDGLLNQVEATRGFHYTPEQRKAYLEIGGTPHLDREYTVFGHVIEGLDVIDKIAGAETAPGDRPKKDVKMKITVIK
ncbi:MAG: PKD domain-containing protein [Bacteroidetes bacterium]|nr:MAG: PKD domain-containing protein [Bacteroidota bacterium]